MSQRLAACELRARVIEDDLTTNLDFVGAVNDISPSCSTGRVERAFTYRVVNKAAALQIVARSSNGQIAIAVFDDCIERDENTCGVSTGGASTGATSTVVTSPFVRATNASPFDVTIVVEGDLSATFTLDIRELPLTIKAPDDVCLPNNNQQVCDPDIAGLICGGRGVSGPANQFRCVVPTTIAEGGACNAVDTRSVCGEGLVCSGSTSTVDGACLTQTSAHVTASLDPATDPTWNRRNASCVASGRILAYDAFVVTNTDTAAITVLAWQSTIGAVASCPGDLFMHVFDGDIDTGTCLEGDDDDGPDFPGTGDCSELEITIPVGQSRTFVVSTFGPLTSALAYQFNVEAVGVFTLE